MQQRIRLDFDTPVLFSLSSVQAGIEAVLDLSVTNLSEYDEIPLTMEIFSEPAFFAPQILSLGVLAPKTKRVFDDLALVYDRTLLSYMPENVTAQITVRISSGAEELVTLSRACDLLRYDCWGGVHFSPELLSCLVTPQQTQVQDVTRSIRRRLQRAPYKVHLEVDGYQNSMDRSAVSNASAAILSATYDAVRSAGVIFSIQPPELTRRGACVQLPETLLATKKGNALDVALLYASCLEAMSLFPVIVFTASRVLVGGFLEPKFFAAPVVDQVEMLQSAVRDGSLCLFEATALAKGTSISFGTACQLAEKICKDINDFYLALDVHACREHKIPSLDNRVEYEDGIHFEKPGLSEDEDVFFNDTAIEQASPVPFNQHLRDMRRFLCDFSPYNRLLAHPEEERVRVVLTEPERFYQSVAVGNTCPLFSSGDSPFGFRADEGNAAAALDSFEKRVASLPDVWGEVCLAFGLIRWEAKDAKVEAPLFLLPVRLVREHGRLDHMFVLAEKPKLNLVLAAFLQEFFELDLTPLKDTLGDDVGEGLKKAFFRVRNAVAPLPSISLNDEEVFFSLFDLSPCDKLAALNVGRLEGHALARAVCAAESVRQDEYTPGSVVDFAPVSVPTPYPMDRAALEVCSAIQKQNYVLVDSPPSGGKTHLGAALAFSALNHSDQTVLYISGENANPRDALHAFEKAGIEDLATTLSLSAPAVAEYSMKETALYPSEEYYILATEFSEEQKRLLCYESILSETLACGCTPEEAIYCFDHVRSAVDCLHFAPEAVGKMDEKTVNAHQKIIHNLALSLSSVGIPSVHPLRYVKARGFSYEIKAEAVHLLDEYTKKFKEYVTFLRGSCAGLLPKAKIHNEAHEKAFLNLLKMVGENRGLNACYFEREIAASDIAKAETIFAYGKECCDMRSGPLSGLNAVAFDLPVKEMIVAWRDSELKRGGARKKAQRELSQKLLSCSKEARELNVLETLYQIEKYQNYRTYLFENAVLIQRLFGVDILAPENDTAEIWTKLATLCRDCITFDRQLSAIDGDVREEAAKLMRGFTSEDAVRAASLYEGILELRAEMEKTRDRFMRYLEVDFKTFCDENRNNLYDEIPRFLKEVSGGMDSFQQWTEFLAAADVAKANGFEQVLDAVQAGTLTGDTLEDAYARAFFAALCEYVFLKYPVLSELRGTAFEEKLAALEEKRERIYEFARRDIRSKHLRRYTNFLSESGIDAQKREVLTPALFSSKTYAITCRYPVLIANATDAVQFLDSTPARFSLLILDDAQTLSMPAALSLIPRAEKVVILGTPSDACSKCRSDVILKRHRESIPNFWDAAHTALKPFHLRFSRQHTGGLLCAMSAASRTASASFPFAFASASVREIRTPGQYDPLTFVNLPEVMQTVDEILVILKKHLDGTALSLGVCASTKMQKLSILQTLARRLREQPELYSVLRDAREPFYVSSLDEEPLGRRDVILWSMTIAPGKSSNVPPRAFPLLNELGGSARIASVVAAARMDLCVLHSIHSDSLEFLRLATDSAETFRRVCRTVFEKGEDVRAIVGTSASYDNPIAERIAAFLREKGCEVNFSLRGGTFALDLVARVPQYPDFALAILLDETVFSVCSGHVLGEVEMMRSLKARGFTPIHVRATDWFENDRAVLDSIFALLPERRKNS